MRSAAGALLQLASNAAESRGAVVRRVPLGPTGAPIREHGRRLLSSLTAPIGSGLSRLVSLLERL